MVRHLLNSVTRQRSQNLCKAILERRTTMPGLPIPRYGTSQSTQTSLINCYSVFEEFNTGCKES